LNAEVTAAVDGAASDAAEVKDSGIGEVVVEMFEYDVVGGADGEWRASLRDGICLNEGCVDLCHCFLV